MQRTIAFVLCLLASGCCEQAGPCPDHAVAVFVIAGEASVPGVSIEGFACAEDEGATVCVPEATITEGDYDLVVQIEGSEPIEATLEVRRQRAPPFSCDCEIPEGSVTIELEPLSEDPDAGA